MPSNEFRGYVLRRLIRRAALHGRRLGLKTGVLATLGGEVVKAMQKHYHELTKARDRITQVLADEEEKFEKTLANGLAMLTEAIARAKAEEQKWIDRDTAFRLSDTYGFPLEMTKEIAVGVRPERRRARLQRAARGTAQPQPRDREVHTGRDALRPVLLRAARDAGPAQRVHRIRRARDRRERSSRWSSAARAWRRRTRAPTSRSSSTALLSIRRAADRSATAARSRRMRGARWSRTRRPRRRA